MEENILPNTLGLQIDNGNIPYLAEAAKWGKFLAVIGFILCGLLIITGLLAGSFFASSFAEVDNELGSAGAISATFFSIWFIIIAVVYFFPSWYLFSFASKMRIALLHDDQVSLNTAFKNLKSCLKFWGIFFIIILCIYAIAIVFSLFASLL